MTIALRPLYTLRGTTVLERVGRVEDGERIKIEFRGAATPDSAILGKAHGNTWILMGTSGPTDTTVVLEVITAPGERLVLELRGHTVASSATDMEIRAAGIIRSNAAAWQHLDGHVALMIQIVTGETAVIETYQF